MTIRQVYERALIELNKLKAPSILLEDYIYFFNKSVQQYINRIYNKCELDQQSSDDLGFLQTTTVIKLDSNNFESSLTLNNDKVWRLELPKDYLHLLNCIATFKKDDYKNTHCNSIRTKEINSPCQRLTADLYPGIINNYYMKPSHKKPYYYLINNNTSNKVVTNEAMDTQIIEGAGYKPVLNGDENEYKFYDLKEQGDRTSTQAAVQIEIHGGTTNWDLKQVYVTYIKSPMYVTMTQEQLLNPIDTTQILEFPDYICYEIINIYVKLLLEHTSDPRLQTNIPVNTSIVTGNSN